MRSLRAPLILVLISSFVFGSYWGVRIMNRKKAREGLLRAAHVVKVLAPSGLISPNLLAQFQTTNLDSDSVQLTFAGQGDELLAQIAKIQPDLVFFFSFQRAVVQRAPGGLTDFAGDNRGKALMGKIAADFLDLAKTDSVSLLWNFFAFVWRKNDPSVPARPTWDDFVQLQSKLSLVNQAGNAWLPLSGRKVLFEDHSVVQLGHAEMAYPPFNQGRWQIAVPEGKKGVLVQIEVSLLKNAAEPEAAHRLINFLLEAKTGLKWCAHTRYASTSRAVENSEADPRLKPSFLRQLPLIEIMPLDDLNKLNLLYH